MSRVVFNSGGKFVNRVNTCPDCKRARKLAIDKRCVQCQIKRKAEAADEPLTECNQVDTWEAVEMFMEGLNA